MTAERTQSFSSSQARWMFLALANCDPECGLPGMCQGSLDVYYELEFTNGEEWSVRHYSADEIGVAETEIFFFVLQIALMIFGLVVREPSTDAHLVPQHTAFSTTLGTRMIAGGAKVSLHPGAKSHSFHHKETVSLGSVASTDPPPFHRCFRNTQPSGK